MVKRAAQWLWLLTILAVLASYYHNLTADFPNGSPWSDWSKFTDEGWYANAAIQHFLQGSWFQPGDFNANVALPVWALLLTPVFHFTGVSLEAARATAVTCFAGALLALFLFFRHYMRWWAAAFAVTLLVLSKYCYAFSRIAILEPLLLLWLSMLLLCVATARLRGRAGWIFSGALIALMVFTKTSSIFLLPGPLYIVWCRSEARAWAFLRAVTLTAITAGVLCAAYLTLVAVTHHWADLNYFFLANQRPSLTLHSRADAFYGAIVNGRFVSHLLYWSSLLVLAGGFTLFPRLRRSGLFGCCGLLLASGIFFIGWHASMQPRYYYTLAPAMAGLVALGLDAGLRQRRRVLVGVLALGMMLFAIRSIYWIARWERHPQYTYISAANDLAGTVRKQHGRNETVMSVSGSQLSLMTHLKTSCDDYGTDEIEDRLVRVNPGWYAGWDDIDPGTLASLHEQYSVHWVGGWPAMDQPLRKVLNLYRLDPLESDTDWSPGDDQMEP